MGLKNRSFFRINKYFILIIICLIAIGAYLWINSRELGFRLDWRTFNQKYYHDFYLVTEYPVYSSYVESSEYFALNEIDDGRNMGGRIENGKYYVYVYLNEELIREEEVDEQEYLHFRDSLYKLMKLDHYFTFSFKDFKAGDWHNYKLKDDCLEEYAEMFDVSVDDLVSVYLKIQDYTDPEGHKGKSISLTFNYTDSGSNVFSFQIND